MLLTRALYATDTTTTSGVTDLTGILDKGSEVFTWIISHVGEAGTAIMSNDLLLLGTFVAVAGSVINFFVRLLHING